VESAEKAGERLLHFKYLKEALDELGMLRSWDPWMDLKD
jgi:hypothetical protein